jgi:hypothetical protein
VPPGGVATHPNDGGNPAHHCRRFPNPDGNRTRGISTPTYVAVDIPPPPPPTGTVGPVPALSCSAYGLPNIEYGTDQERDSSAARCTTLNAVLGSDPHASKRGILLSQARGFVEGNDRGCLGGQDCGKLAGRSLPPTIGVRQDHRRGVRAAVRHSPSRGQLLQGSRSGHRRLRWRTLREPRHAR